MTIANPSNITSINDILVYVNTSTNNLTGIVILIIVFMVFYLSFSKKYNVKTTFIGCTWVTMLSAMLLNYIGMVGTEVAIFCIVIAFVSIFVRR